MKGTNNLLVVISSRKKIWKIISSKWLPFTTRVVI